MYYSRSSINGFNTDYGFNIVSFNKKGELLHNQEFKTPRPVAVYDIDVDEVNKMVCGVGGYFDDFTQFSFCAPLQKTTSTTTVPSTTQVRLLLTNIDHEFLQINQLFYNTKIDLYSINGQRLKTITAEEILDISNLKSGTYIVQYFHENTLIAERFVKM